MTTNVWNASIPYPDRHLLKNQAIRSDLHVWMDHHPVGMRQQESSTDPGIDGDVGAGDDAPEPVTKDRNFSGENEKMVSGVRVALIRADAREQGTRRASRKGRLVLSRQVRLTCGNSRIRHRFVATNVNELVVSLMRSSILNLGLVNLPTILSHRVAQLFRARSNTSIRHNNI